MRDSTGLANAGSSIDIVELESKKPAATVNGKACKGIFQVQAAAVKALAESTRQDLTVRVCLGALGFLRRGASLARRGPVGRVMDGLTRLTVNELECTLCCIGFEWRRCVRTRGGCRRARGGCGG